MERTILHSDLNNFYASVECLYNPKIREFPVAVCGDQEARHGIVLAKNQIAKKLGVTTGEAIWQAKMKCPDLVTVPANFSLYLKISKLAKAIYKEYTDQAESFGIDESWLDVTGSISLFGSGEAIADTIRKRIFQELGITASVGVSFNKIFAKLGSDMKKPDATTVITKENFKEKVWGLSVGELLYVGRSTENKLKNININTIGDLANTDINFLYGKLGKWGIVLHRFANGQEDSPVSDKGEETYIKSVGNSITAPRDLETKDDVKKVIYMLADSVAARLRCYKLKCSTVQISIRDNCFFSCERQAKLQMPSFLTSEIAEKAFEIFETKYEMRNAIRSLGVRGSGLLPEHSAVQLSFFYDLAKREKQEAMEQAVDKIRSRYGYHAIKKGILLLDQDLTGINPKEEHVIHPLNFFDGGIL